MILFLHFFQVVLNEFLEQSEEPMKARDSTSPVPVRNKAGNGLKCKNSKKSKKSSNKNSNSTEAASTSADNQMHIWSDLTDENPKESANESSKRKRKLPILPLNLEDHLLPDDENPGGPPAAEGSNGGRGGPAKRPKLDVLSALVEVEAPLDAKPSR